MSNSSQRLKILFIEDEPADVELVEIKLIQEGFVFDFEIVDNQEDFLTAVETFKPDIIVSDYSMPIFNGLDALNLSKELHPEIPFIILTNSLNEEVAVICLKAGATDYVLKSNLTKLPFSIKEAMDQVDLKKSVIIAEQNLKDNEEKYRNLVEISPEGIFILQNNSIVFVNNSGKELVSAESEEDVLDKSMHDFLPLVYNHRIKDNLEEIFVNPKIGKPLEARLQNLDGIVFDVQISATTFIYKSIPAVQVIISDISQRKLTEAHLRQNQKMETLGQIAAGLAHQLNTPLAVISMRLQMLEDNEQYIEDEFFQKQIGITKENINRISWLTKRMLSFARKSDDSPVEINVNNLIISIEAFLENLLNKAKVSIIKEFDELPVIKIEPQMLEQVIINIITNAIDAIPDGGLISVNTSQRMIKRHNYLTIEISDKGTGMSKEERLRLFEPFYTTKTAKKGTGLGMFISYNIIKEMGGNLEVNSELGVGTTIAINLPLVNKDFV